MRNIIALTVSFVLVALVGIGDAAYATDWKNF